MNGFAQRFLQLLLMFCLPLVFLLGSVRALMSTDAFLRFEYGRPGMTTDGYRFVPEGRLWDTPERLRYATQTLVWLRDGLPAAELAALREDKTGRALYRPGEVGHMADVQRLTNAFNVVLGGAALLVLAAALPLAARRATHPALARALLAAGVFTWTLAGVFAVLLAGGASSGAWDALFVGFHQVFFPQGNWQFYYSDTLIRLFPEQLWFDFAATGLGATLALATLSGVVGYVWGRRAARV